ncbi:MAG: cytidine deaminase [Gemmatimonadales bacterium]
MADPLEARAKAVQAEAYAPYSNFLVGAAVETTTGEQFVGCNVENASYGLTICAERAAVAQAIAGGFRQFRRIVVVTSSEPPAPPCGACRQFLREFGPDLIVESIGPQSKRSWSLRDLLPDAFGSELLA